MEVVMLDHIFQFLELGIQHHYAIWRVVGANRCFIRVLTTIWCTSDEPEKERRRINIHCRRYWVYRTLQELPIRYASITISEQENKTNLAESKSFVFMCHVTWMSWSLLTTFPHTLHVATLFCIIKIKYRRKIQLIPISVVSRLNLNVEGKWGENYFFEQFRIRKAFKSDLTSHLA